MEKSRSIIGARREKNPGKVHLILCDTIHYIYLRPNADEYVLRKIFDFDS